MSMFSRSTAVEKSSAGRKKRSESASGISRVKENRRIPAIEILDITDVVTLVSVELSRAVITFPKVDLGVFLKTSTNSRLDINRSDTTIIITAAILDHIGNEKMSRKILSKSATVTKYYEKMGLANPVTREMFVTILFALAPNFVTILEKSLRIAIDRSSELGSDVYGEQQMGNALVTLKAANTITESEMIKSLSLESSNIDDVRVAKIRNSIQTTPTEMVAPSDSISVIGRRLRMDQSNVMEYITRRRSGKEPSFNAVFPSAREPLLTTRKNNREGLGFVSNTETEWERKVNEVLGRHTVKSIKIETGRSRQRRPRVEDFLDQEEVSTEVLVQPPDVESNVDHYLNYKHTKGVSPTDVDLPRSVIKRVDSTEILMASLGLK